MLWNKKQIQAIQAQRKKAGGRSKNLRFRGGGARLVALLGGVQHLVHAAAWNGAWHACVVGKHDGGRAGDAVGPRKFQIGRDDSLVALGGGRLQLRDRKSVV